MHVVIVTRELIGPHQNGGIGTFCTHLARLLCRERSQRVTILYTGELIAAPESWRPAYEQQGIDVIIVPPVSVSSDCGGLLPFQEVATRVLHHLPEDADIVYMQENGADGMYLARQMRFQAAARPVLVTMMHGNRDWVLETMDIASRRGSPDLLISFAEQYTVRHSDYVVSNSAYLMEWVKAHGWHLPDETAVLKLPFLPPIEPGQAPAPAESFRRVIFFGRLETRKGFELFVDALLRISPYFRHRHLPVLDEVVFLGKDDVHRYETADHAADLLRQSGYQVQVLDTLDSYQAQQYIADHAADSLVVIPSKAEALGYTVIESSLIPGVHLICAGAGGIPEVFGVETADFLFPPTLAGLSQKLIETLEAGPVAQSIPPYAYQQINDNWLAFHDEVCQQARARVTVPEQDVSLMPLDVYIYCDTGDSQSVAAVVQQVRSAGGNDVTVYAVAASTNVATRLHSRYAAADDVTVLLPAEKNRTLPDHLNAAINRHESPYIFLMHEAHQLAPAAITMFRRAIQQSDDDCLTSWLLTCVRDAHPAYHDVSAAAVCGYQPVGACAAAGMFENCFGRGGLIMRRATWQAVGGMNSRLPPSGWDDALYELLTRCVLWGYRLDVVPHYLVQTDKIELPAPQMQTQQRVLSHYRYLLQQAGVGYLVNWLYAANQIARLYPQMRSGVALTDADLRVQLRQFEVDNSLREIDVFHMDDLQKSSRVATRIPWRKLVQALLKRVFDY